MTTALIISELLELHDDTLIADIDRAFDELDRSVAVGADLDGDALMLIVDELVEEMLAPDPAIDESSKLSIAIELDIYDDDDSSCGEVAEVA